MFNKENINEILKKLKKKLPEGRYVHTLGVAYVAASLAMRYEYDYDKALIAGLLHDCAKYLKPSEMLELANKYKIPVSETEQFKPDLLHAKLGGYFARKKYNINDDDIIEAINCHTTGKPNMNILDKILYISDYIEPSRSKMPRLPEIRKEAFINIDNALKMILTDSLNYLNESGMTIDKKTEETYNYYCK